MAEPTFFDHPFHIDGRGRAAETPVDDHVRDLIYQLLFTAPGERVNRPDLGCGVGRLLFMPNRDTLAVATQFLIQGALERWLGDIIEARSVQVRANEERLAIQVVYLRKDTSEQKEITFFAPPSAA